MKTHSAIKHSVSLIVCIVFALCLLPTGALAAENATFSAGPTFTTTPNKHEITIIEDVEYYVWYTIKNNSSSTISNLKVRLYDGGTEIGEEKIIASIAKNKTAKVWFQWTAHPGNTLKSVLYDSTGETITESETTVNVIDKPTSNYIQLHDYYYLNDTNFGVIQGFKVLGAEVATHSYSIDNDTDPRSKTIEVLLKSDTASNASITIKSENGRVGSIPALATQPNLTTKQLTTSEQQFYQSGTTLSLTNGEANTTIYAYSKATGGSDYNTYKFHFSISEVDTQNDPNPTSVTSISVTKAPNRTQYTAGEVFDRAGMVITATLDNQETAPVNGVIISPSSPLELGTTSVDISYGNHTVSIPVTVTPDTSISDVTILNGQMFSNLNWTNGTITTLENKYRAVCLYDEEYATYTFKLKNSVEVYVGDEKATINDGLCTIQLTPDGSEQIIRVQGAAPYETTQTDYSFTTYQQSLSGMPTRVDDYLCVASQYTNGAGLGPYGINPISTLRGYNTTGEESGFVTTSPTSLGNFGGYITYYFEDGFSDNPNNPYGIDFIVYGNSYDGSSEFAEPGQVSVSTDGVTWYNLAGSLHYEDSTIWNETVTYHQDGTWELSSGGQGILRNNWPRQDYYPLHTWSDSNTQQIVLSGVRLRSSSINEVFSGANPPYPDFGYADCGDEGEDNHADNPYLGTVVRGVDNRIYSDRTDGFDLAWAVDAEGMPVNPVRFENGVHYVRVQTASFLNNGNIGEKSTEVHMVRVAQPADAAVGQTDAPAKVTVDGAEVALVAGQNVYEDVPIKGSFAVQVSAGENANIYINSQRGESAEFDAMPAHGIVRVIVQEGEKEPWIAYLNLTEAETEPAVPVVEALISAIGTVTVGSGDAINAARTAYDALRNEAKTSVTNYATLTAAEAAYADLTAAAGTDALIDAIGEVSLESAASITAAQDAYDALTDAQKALVTKLDTLTAAKAAYDTLAAAAEQEAIDAAAAKGVTDKIAAIGTVTLQSESAITAARSAYNALTDTQKAMVTNLDTLTAAEAALEELKNPTVTLTLNANGGTINGKATDNAGFKANNDGQALPTPEGAADLRFVGWEYGQKLYTTYAHGVLPDGATLTAVWEDTTTVTPSQNNITVSFRLIGSSKSDADIDLADGDYHGAEYQTWIATRNYTLPEGSKAIDLIDLALQRAGLTTSNPGGNYIEGICAPATLGGQEMREFTNGNRSGWMYTLNGVHANNGVAQQTLANGDAVILHYVDDYAYEVADWDRLGGVGYPALGDSTYHNAWLAAPDVNPNAPDYSGGVPSGNTDSDKKDETKTDATATVADNGEVVLAPEVTDGEAKAEVSAETVAEALKESEDADVLTITVDTTDADKVEATLDADAVKAAAEADVDLHVETEVGTVKVDSDTLVELAEDGKDIAVTVTTNEDGTTTIDVTADGESVDAKVKVELPAAEDNQVLVIVDTDGNETVIKKSLVEGDKVYAEIPAGATVKVVEADGVEFGDVADGAWYADAVEFVASHELFQGTNNGFEPDTTMNRAMLVTVLYRLEDASASGGSTFADVDPASWYAEAVAWADETGIVTGTDNGFEPNAPVTREQIATILYRYANVIGLDTSTKSSLSGFPDSGETSSWASDAMQWAVSVGLFQGDGHGALNPKGDATRAQVATLFERLVGLIVK